MTIGHKNPVVELKLELEMKELCCIPLETTNNNSTSPFLSWWGYWFQMPNLRTLAQTASAREPPMGSFLPRRQRSMSHIPMTNSSLQSQPLAPLSTSFQIWLSMSGGKRLRVQMSLATKGWIPSDSMMSLVCCCCCCSSGGNGGGGTDKRCTRVSIKWPLFAAQTPSYRLRSFSLIIVSER